MYTPTLSIVYPHPLTPHSPTLHQSTLVLFHLPSCAHPSYTLSFPTVSRTFTNPIPSPSLPPTPHLSLPLLSHLHISPCFPMPRWTASNSTLAAFAASTHTHTYTRTHTHTHTHTLTYALFAVYVQHVIRGTLAFRFQYRGIVVATVWTASVVHVAFVPGYNRVE